MKDRICPITKQPCITGVCSTWECFAAIKVDDEKGNLVDIINGISLKIAQSYKLGAEQTLKFAEKISKYMLEKIK